MFRYKPFFNDNKKIGMFEPRQMLERKIFIHQRWSGALQYLRLTLFSSSLLATQPNHETPTLAGFKSGPASENEKTQFAKSYLLFRSSNRFSGSIFLIS